MNTRPGDLTRVWLISSQPAKHKSSLYGLTVLVAGMTRRSWLLRRNTSFVLTNKDHTSCLWLSLGVNNDTCQMYLYSYMIPEKKCSGRIPLSGSKEKLFLFFIALLGCDYIIPERNIIDYAGCGLIGGGVK